MQKIIPLVVLLAAYSLLIILNYWSWPIYDGLHFLTTIVTPAKNIYFIDRLFHQYLSYPVIMAFDNHLEGAALTSFLYHGGIIAVTFLIVLKLGDAISATLTAALVAVTPLFFAFPTQFLTDPTALFWGLCALYFSLRAPGAGNGPASILWPTLSGLCLSLSIFSKIFGLSFLPTLLWLAWEKRAQKAPLYLGAGFGLGLLLLAFLDSYFLGDFFYHLRPATYLLYTEGIVSKTQQAVYSIPIKELYRTFLPHFLLIYPFYLMMSFVQLFRLYENYRENRESIKRIWQIVLIVGSYFVILTPLFLTAPTMPLSAHYAYLLLVPLLIAFGLSIREAWMTQKGNHHLQSRISLVLAFIFAFVLLTLRKPEFYQSFFYEKSLWGRFYLLFSVWMVVAMLPALVFVKRLTLGNKRRPWVYGIAFSSLLIWHNATWASIFGNKPTGLNRPTQSFLKEVKPSMFHYLNCPPLEKEGQGRQMLALMKKFEGGEPMAWRSNPHSPDLTVPHYLASSLPPEDLTRQIGFASIRIEPLDPLRLDDCRIYRLTGPSR